MNVKGPVVASLSLLALSAAAWGSISGDTLLVEDVSATAGTPAGLVTYRFYVPFSSAGDSLLAVEDADVTATNSFVHARDSDPDPGSPCSVDSIFDIPPEPAFYGLCPALQYDSFISVGDERCTVVADPCPGGARQWIDTTPEFPVTTEFPGGQPPFGATTVQTGWFDANPSTPSTPDASGRVLVMQLTVPVGTCISGTVVAVPGAGSGDPMTMTVRAPDPDLDALSDCEEATLGTDPQVADTDGDGLPDGVEADDLCLDPLNADTDGDGLSDGAEVNTHLTNPCVADSDGDGLDDGEELTLASGGDCPDPLNDDSDDDGEFDGNEVTAGSNPCVDESANSPDVVADALQALCGEIQATHYSKFVGPVVPVKKARRAVLAIHACIAAGLVECGHFQAAMFLLDAMLHRVDGNSPPPDWMIDSPERDSIRMQIEDAIEALGGF